MMSDSHQQPAREPGMRASDDDRERAAAVLRDSFAQGRLDMEELSQRLDETYAARTVAQLRSALRELPELPPAPRPDPTHDRPARADAGFRFQATKYAAVMVLLVAVWAMTGAEHFWPVWPMLGWGIPLFSRRWATGAVGCR